MASATTTSGGGAKSTSSPTTLVGQNGAAQSTATESREHVHKGRKRYLKWALIAVAAIAAILIGNDIADEGRKSVSQQGTPIARCTNIVLPQLSLGQIGDWCMSIPSGGQVTIQPRSNVSVEVLLEDFDKADVMLYTSDGKDLGKVVLQRGATQTCFPAGWGIAKVMPQGNGGIVRVLIGQGHRARFTTCP